MGYKDPERQREYQRKWVADRRAAYFTDKKCTDCGSVTALELDHRDPSTKVSHNIWSWSAKKRNAELFKCQVLCSSCHLTKTTEVDRVAEHGTNSRYTSCKWKCRCTLCASAHTKLHREKRRQGLPW